MQAAETVYEFGSSPDEDDDNNGAGAGAGGQPSPHKPNRKKSQLNYQQHQQQSNQLQSDTATTGINKTTPTTNTSTTSTTTSINNQKLNTSFSSLSDSHQLSHSPNLKSNPKSAHHHHSRHHATSSDGNNDISSSDDQLLLNDTKLNTIAPGITSNTSNTSLSSNTTSSRGNISQSGIQSLSASSQKAIGHQQSSSSQQQNPNFDSNVISERVKNLATQIYQELKRIISRCNYDEDILSGLMPLIVRVLESLDLALIENQQLQVELELCKDDNEQLVIMFEKEKAAKRAIDKKLIESEYANEEERQQYQQKIESLENVVKMFELKSKNASDQATRFEEKEAERKKEYNKLHDRYTELLKSHCDVVERFRHLAGNTEVAKLGSINVPQQMVASSSDLTISDVIQPQHISKIKSKSDDIETERGHSTRTRDTLKSWNAETELTLEDASLVVIDDMLESSKAADLSSHNESERTAGETEGEHEKETENDSIAYTSMEKEFRKLIQENRDLLNTKNALNIVKDDLIAEVDRLTNEVFMYEQAVGQLNATKDQMKQKVCALDTELRKTKEELDKAKQKIRENNEEGVPYSQRKRFGRAEMAKVLMERNNYKERYMELQDAVRYTELVRANKVETEKRSGLWKFFSNLFGAPLAIGPAGQTPSRNSSPVVSYHGSTVALTGSDQQANTSGSQFVATDAIQAGSVIRGGSVRTTNQRLSSNSDLIVLMDSDLNVDRSHIYKDGIGRLSSDTSRYIHAYGWSLPASSIRSVTTSGGSNESMSIVNSLHKIPGLLSNNSSYADMDSPVIGSTESAASCHKLSGLQVPIPQYCRPLTGDSLGMKIWCATAIDLSGGYAATSEQENTSRQQASTSGVVVDSDTSGSMVNISSSTPVKPTNALKMLEREVDKALGGSLSEDVIGGEDISIPKTSSTRPILKTTTEMVLSALPMIDDTEELSSCVWICSTQHSRSKITIIDIKTKPNELLDSFYVPTFLYVVKSVPGSKSSDLLGIHINTEKVQKDSATLKMLNDLISSQKKEFYKLVEVDLEAEIELRKNRNEMLTTKNEQDDKSSQQVLSPDKKPEETDSKARVNEDDAEISRILDNNVSVGVATLQKLNDFVAHTQPQSEKSSINASESTKIEGNGNGEQSCQDVVYYQPISTSLSTVWMGGKDSILYIHSAIGQWKDCVACVKLPDSILQICHFRGRVFVALADGSLCVFFRNVDTKQWEFFKYLLIDINLMADITNDTVDFAETSYSTNLQSRLTTSSRTSSAPTNVTDNKHNMSINQEGTQHTTNLSPQTSTVTTPTKASKNSNLRTKVAGIRCLEIANKNLWIGYQNKVLIIDPISLKLKHAFSVVPQVDNQIRQLISMKDGVFVCLRSDLILRLYSSIKPYQHIQNIDIEPVVTRLISPKTFVISHITAMRVADNTLWIGNAHGIILTIPCKLVPQIAETPVMERHGEFEESPTSLSIARFVPKCEISNAQISFHGHKDAVKFFIHAHNLMLSGGQGYLDFRLDMDDQSKLISDKSHLILWQLPN